MTFLRRHSAGLLMALIELTVGVLLLVKPAGFTAISLIVLGAALSVLGAAGVVRYFRTEPLQAARQQSLARGLALLTAGLFCALRAGWLVSLFPVLTALYGAVLFFTGLYKVQRAVDIHRLQLGSGLLAGISALATLLVSVIILLNPFAGTAALWIFIGAALIAEAILDVLACLKSQRSE